MAGARDGLLGTGYHIVHARLRFGGRNSQATGHKFDQIIAIIRGQTIVTRSCQQNPGSFVTSIRNIGLGRRAI